MDADPLLGLPDQVCHYTEQGFKTGDKPNRDTILHKRARFYREGLERYHMPISQLELPQLNQLIPEALELQERNDDIRTANNQSQIYHVERIHDLMDTIEYLRIKLKQRMINQQKDLQQQLEDLKRQNELLRRYELFNPRHPLLQRHLQNTQEVIKDVNKALYTIQLSINDYPIPLAPDSPKGPEKDERRRLQRNTQSPSPPRKQRRHEE